MPTAIKQTSDATVNDVPINVYPGESFYVPAFQLFLNGVKLPFGAVEDVVSVSYTDSLTDVDFCEIVVGNWDPDKATKNSKAFAVSPFKYSDSNLFNPWQGIDLYMGYVQGGERPVKMMTGEITTMTPSFPASGASTLSIRALNLLHRFRSQQQTKVFIDKTDSEICRSIVNDLAAEIKKKQQKLTLQVNEAEINANIAIESQKKVTYQIINNQYPISYLLQRSREIGYEVYLTEDGSDEDHRIVTLHYLPSADVNKIFYRLAWGETLISFQPTLQTANQVSSLTVKGWDVKGKTKIEHTAMRKDIDGIVHPTDLDIAETNLSQKLEIVVDKPIQNVAEAKRLAESKLLHLAQGIVQGKGKTIGLPNLRAGNKIQIEGLGTRFSGIYLVTSTTHTIGEGGYTTDFTGRMEARISA